MTDISKESLIKSIKAVLKDADLDQLSAKKIRKMLEAEYKTDFTERKDEIDKLVMQLITDNDSDEEKEEEKKGEAEVKQKMANGSTPAPKRAASPAKKGKGKNDAQDDNAASPAKKGKGKNDAQDDNAASPVKKGKGKNDAQDDNAASPAKKDKGKIDAQDDKLLSNDEGGDDKDDDDDSDLGEIEDVVPKKKAKTQPSSKKAKSAKKLNDEELAKQLQEDEGIRPSRRCKAQPVVRKQKKPRKESAKGTSVYSRPCALLPPLDEIMGTDKMPRPMIVKRLWEIVKERDLLDPKNKQFMLCDPEMLGLFGKGRVRMFGAMKLLKPYIKDLPKE